MKHADLIMGYSCNLNCSFCMGEPSKRSKNYSYDTLKSSIIDLKKQGYDSLCFNGGEPTIRKCLIDLAKLSKHIGFKKIKLQTNGLILAERECLQKLLEAGIDSVGITVCDYNKTKYERSVKARGSFSLLLKALENIRLNNLAVEADIVITKSNYKDLRDTISFLMKYGIKKFNFKFAAIGGNAKINASKVIPKIEDVRAPLKECLDFSRKNPAMNCTIQYIPYCMLKGYEEFMLDLEKTQITIREGIDSFEFKDSFNHTHKKPKECSMCEFFNKCPGIDKEYGRIFGRFNLSQSKKIECDLSESAFPEYLATAKEKKRSLKKRGRVYETKDGAATRNSKKGI